jgi:exonuclease VII large subunit
MSSPFAQKFMGKRPFSDEQYEAIANEYRNKEKEQSDDRGDAPDYETKMRLQKELAKELEQKKQEGSSSPNQMSPLNRYVSIEPAMQRLQRDAENIAAMDNKGKVSAADKIKNKAKQYSEFSPSEIKLDYKAFETSKSKNYGI